jgi:Flp pilus assembly protein TadD
MGDLDKALDKYHTATHMSPNMFEPYYNCGTIYLRQRAYSKAIPPLLIAARLKPTDPFVQNNLGVAYDNLHDGGDAAKAFRKAADLKPDNLTFVRNAGLALARIRSADALPYLEKCLGDGTDPAIALALGEAYSRAGRKTDALKYYEGLRDAEAKNSTFWFNLGVLRAQNQDAQGAEQAYRRALEINPNDLDALNNLGLMLFRKGGFAESTTLFDKLSGLNPGSIATKLNLGAAAAKSGDLKKAIGAWKEVVRADPKQVSVRMDLANALWDQGDVENAKYHYLQVLAVEKDNAEALNGIGLCHLKAGKLVQAEAAFRSAIEADSKLIGAYNNLAVTLQRMNQVSEAVKVLEKAVKIAPNDDELQRNLARMRGEG